MGAYFSCFGRCRAIVRASGLCREIDVIDIPVELVEPGSRHRTHFPPHEPRKASATYTRTHRNLKHLPCFICGVINEKGQETHHFYIEKAAANAIDWKVFGEFADNTFNIQTGESLAQFDWTAVALDPDLFVDSEQNMVVLCKQHHTSGSFGIHHVPFPDWILQKFPKDGFQFLS